MLEYSGDQLCIQVIDSTVPVVWQVSVKVWFRTGWEPTICTDASVTGAAEEHKHTRNKRTVKECWLEGWVDSDLEDATAIMQGWT